MGNTGKGKFFVIVGFLACIIAVFIYVQFRASKNRTKNIPENAKNIVNVQAPAAISETVQNDNGEPQKMMPTAIPIFMYHYIRDYFNPSDPIGMNLSVSPQKLEEQLAWLAENGYQTAAMDFFGNPQPVSFKPIILTFDDGYQDAYDSALPILQKYKMVGTFYLIVDKIGTPGYLTWEEIAQMQKSGMVFGSHTLTHPDLRNLPEKDLENEIRASQEILEKKLGVAVTDFCYPSGKLDDRVLKELLRDNYKTAVTTVMGISDVKADPYLLKRIRIANNSKIQSILRK